MPKVCDRIGAIGGVASRRVTAPRAGRRRSGQAGSIGCGHRATRGASAVAIDVDVGGAEISTATMFQVDCDDDVVTVGVDSESDELDVRAWLTSSTTRQLTQSARPHVLKGDSDVEELEPQGASDVVEVTNKLTKGSSLLARTSFRRKPWWDEYLDDVVLASKLFWLRYEVRRKLLRRLAEECARFGPLVRQRAAELRAAAARQRIELLRSGDLEGYQSAVGELRERRLQEILDETTRILDGLKPVVSHNSGGAHAIAGANIEQPSTLKNGNLMQHQLRGLQWLVQQFGSGLSGILADDMGLGKTLQTIALVCHLLERGERGPHLVVVPVSTLHHWQHEFSRWAPSLQVMIFRSKNNNVEVLLFELLQSLESLNVVITTYETLVNHRDAVCRVSYHCVVVDEGQRLKNCKTQLNKAVRSVSCKHKLLLTGTPLQNSLRELWSLLAFVAPREFGSVHDFEQWFALPAPPPVKLQDDSAETPGAVPPGDRIENNSEESVLLSEEEELLIIQRLHSVLRPFMLRRSKASVLPDLPEKLEVVVWVPLSSWQSTLYHGGLQRCALKLGDGARHSMTMALRKAINHPYHFVGASSEVRKKEENLYRASGKFEYLQRVLPRLWRFRHKAVIFAQMTSLLDLLEELLEGLGLRYERMDGSLQEKKRSEAISRFDRDADVAVLLLSTRAGALGLNLQAADTVILFDSDWNPQMDVQAIDRVYRIGQWRPVRAVRLMTPTSFDRGLLGRTSHKLDMERKIIGAGNFSNDEAATARLERAAHLRRLVQEARGGKDTDTAPPTSLSDANRLLARSPEEFAAFEAHDVEVLGLSAANEQGGFETLEERLERCGRLMAQREVPSCPGRLTSKPKAQKRRRVA